MCGSYADKLAVFLAARGVSEAASSFAYSHQMGWLTLLTMLKGLPTAYNKDLQEDKQALFDTLGTIEAALQANAEPMIPQPCETAAIAQKDAITPFKGFPQGNERFFTLHQQKIGRRRQGMKAWKSR